jgi:hypothetical protein
MLSFVPLHLSCIERNPQIKSWIQSWLGNEAEFLTPDLWFSRGHSHDGGHYDMSGFWRVNIRPGKFVWTPPAAADVALEELRKALIKRRDSTHVFLCPRLLTPQWRRQLNKACDLVVFMNAGSEVWPKNMYEPLTIGIVFPFLTVRPWQLRGTPKMLHLGRAMPKLLEDTNVATRDLLYQLCNQMWKLRGMSENVVRRVLYFRSNSKISCQTTREL